VYKKIIIILLCWIVFSFSRSSVIAKEKESIIFRDDFSNLNTNTWHIDNINGDVLFGDGLSLASENNQYFPFLYSQINLIPQSGDYFLEVKYTFPKTTDFGVGFGLGNVVPDYGIREQVVSDSDFIQFQLWQGVNDGHLLQTNRCPELNVCDTFRTTIFQLPIASSEQILRIEYRGNNYYIYLNGIKVSNDALLSINRRPTVFWIGNNIRLDGVQNWTSITVNELKIGTYAEDHEVTPVIIIPGLGASWDLGAIMTGAEGSNWKIPGFVKNYDGLKTSFLKAGYTDENLFVFAYDWRRPLDVLADRLNTYIEDKVPDGEKVNLVGHSMGGLVARAYAQKYGTSRINRILTIGSPNTGTVKAYGVWEGAILFDDSWWSKVALELTAHFGVIAGESNIQTVQRTVPSLKDLLPTYNYLIRNGVTIPWTSMIFKNNYLSNLNQNISQINPLLSAIYSEDIPTNSLIKVVPHTIGDLDTWVDGKPIANPFINEAGDGTVIKTSAIGPFTNTLQGSGWHGELVTKGENIKKIFGLLDLDQSKVVEGMDEGNKKVFIAALKSPGKIDVCDIDLNRCNARLGLYFPDQKLFILPGYGGESLVVKISENGERGVYNLHLGDIDKSADWEVLGGKIDTKGQIDTYVVKENNDRLIAQSISTNKNVCKGSGWHVLDFIKFKNQGDCVSWYEKGTRLYRFSF
jgi:pimeloyl-ACP methyl ester carboxylesterase